MNAAERTSKMNEIRSKTEPLDKEIYELECKIRSARYKIEAEHNKLIEAELFAQFGDTLRDMRIVKNNLGDEYRTLLNEEAIERAAVNIKAKGFTEGQEVVYWEASRWDSKYIQLDHGVVQIFRDGDECPDNMKWNKPVVGDAVIRLYKKNGELGKKIERLGGYYNGVWLAVGVDPNKKAEEEKNKAEAEKMVGACI